MHHLSLLVFLSAIPQAIALQGLLSSPIACTEPDGTPRDVSEALGSEVNPIVQRCIRCICMRGVISCENRADLCNHQAPTLQVQNSMATADNFGAPKSPRFQTRPTSTTTTPEPTSTTKAPIPVRFLLTLPPKPKNNTPEDEPMDYAGDEPATEPEEDFSEIETTTQVQTTTQPPKLELARSVQGIYQPTRISTTSQAPAASYARHETISPRQFYRPIQQDRNLPATQTANPVSSSTPTTTTTSRPSSTTVLISSRLSRLGDDQLPSRLSFKPSVDQVGTTRSATRLAGEQAAAGLNDLAYEQPRVEPVLEMHLDSNWVIIICTAVMVSSILILGSVLLYSVTELKKDRTQAPPVGNQSPTDPRCMNVPRSFIYNFD